MLCLLGVMLSVLCLVSPAPLRSGRACPANSLFMETIQDLQKLRSKGSSEITPLNNTLEKGGNAATYLEGFIEALKNSKKSAEQKVIVRNLRKIQAYGESCAGWKTQSPSPSGGALVQLWTGALVEKQRHKSALKEHHWKAVEEYDFFNNLENLLRFLGQNALPEETN